MEFSLILGKKNFETPILDLYFITMIMMALVLDG